MRSPKKVRWMRGVREGWFKECKIDKVKVKLCLVPVVTVSRWLPF